MLPLHLPGKAALTPNIRPSLAATDLLGTFLECEPYTGGVGGCGWLDPEQGAEVIEIGLRSRSLR